MSGPSNNGPRDDGGGVSGSSRGGRGYSESQLEAKYLADKKKKEEEDAARAQAEQEAALANAENDAQNEAIAEGYDAGITSNMLFGSRRRSNSLLDSGVSRRTLLGY